MRTKWQGKNKLWLWHDYFFSHFFARNIRPEFARETRGITLNKTAEHEYFPQFLFRAWHGIKIVEKLVSLRDFILFLFRDLPRVSRAISSLFAGYHARRMSLDSEDNPYGTAKKEGD